MSSVDSLVSDVASFCPRAARMPARVTFSLGRRTPTQAAIRRLFGRRLGPCELAALAGAPDGAEAELDTYRGGLLLEFSDPPTYACHGVSRVVVHCGRPVLVIDALHIHRASLRGHGLGLRVFSRQLAAAQALNLPRIETHAGRRKDENGYYTWPRYGFAGRLPEGLRRRLPASLAHAADVLDLMQTTAGRVWWRRHGLGLCVSFDVSPGSRSQRAFHHYRTSESGGQEHTTLCRMRDSTALFRG